MRIITQPLDTLFFRDGKPFSMGDESWADGIFPPYPSVIYGALRSWFIANHKSDITDNLIDNESAKIQINSICYNLSGELHFPLPLDFVEKKRKRDDAEAKRLEDNREERSKTYEISKLQLERNNTINNYPLKEILYATEGVESVDDGLIGISHLKQYLEGTLAVVEAKKIKDIAVSEAKVGIGRDKRINSTLEGNLYRVGMRRLKELQIVIDFDLPDSDFEPSKLIKLGGEGKVVSLKVLRRKNKAIPIYANTIKLNNPKENHPNEFKLYLATPAIFKNGWKPDLEKEEIGIKAELVAASIGKLLNIGGFDMKERRPKPMLKAVPAGSVYYYKTKEDPQKVLEKLQGKLISDRINGIDTIKEGYGLTFVGNF